VGTDINLWLYLSTAWLPDGIFSNQISQFGLILEGLGMKNNGTLYGRLEYVTAIFYILGLFGNLVVSWYIFPHFGTLYQEKSGNPGRRGVLAAG
jgi:hypothetical protein